MKTNPTWEALDQGTSWVFPSPKFLQLFHSHSAGLIHANTLFSFAIKVFQLSCEICETFKTCQKLSRMALSVFTAAYTSPKNNSWFNFLAIFKPEKNINCWKNPFCSLAYDYFPTFYFTVGYLTAQNTFPNMPLFHPKMNMWLWITHQTLTVFWSNTASGKGFLCYFFSF